MFKRILWEYQSVIMLETEIWDEGTGMSSWLKIMIMMKISKILGFHGGDYEECRLLGCYAVWLL
jgi:hypothetical protein